MNITAFFRRWRIQLLLLILFSAGTAFWITRPVLAAAAPRSVVIVFWGDGCPHCEQARPFLKKLVENTPGAEMREYEVWYNDANREYFRAATASKGFEPRGVPTIFIGEKYWEGYSEVISQEMKTALAACSLSGCSDPFVGIDSGKTQSSIIKGPAEGFSPNPPSNPGQPAQKGDFIDIPFWGRVDLAGQSLWISTGLISFVDGFNPCSLWVLSMLLALTLHTGSRRKVTIIGLIFLTVTAGVYALFIAGLFTLFTVVSFVGWIQAVVATLALFFALVNIKDYFWYKEGLSFTIADDKKPGIFKRMRAVMDAGNSFWALAGATIALGAGVSLVEFSCTAGFPVLWTNLLASQQVGPLEFTLLLLLYLVIYQLDELAIFFTAVFTLKSSRLEEKHGRLLKLGGGMLMLSLAVVMIINPALMNNLSSSLLVFGAAVAGVGLVLFVHRVVLPRFGIYIGTEMQPRPRRKHK